MTNLKVDLYSDTVSKPTPAMRRAMAEAEVGNEQAHEDPTVNKLCEMVAELLGKEDAVYLPSGTMCNAIAYRVHCQQGEEVILDKTGHPITSEAGGPAALAGVMLRPLDGVRGIFTPEQVRDAVSNPANNHAPLSRLVSVENTVNFGTGKVWPLDAIRAVTAEARSHGLATHMDGARLLNAVIASGTSAKDYADTFDSTWIDLSKGLGCPVGAVLVGDKEFIRRAWRFKHQFGGAMRQAGIIAAAGVYALEHHVARLAEDHANAKAFAERVADIPGIDIAPDEVESNIVFFHTPTDRPAAEVRDALIAKGVRIGAMGPHRMRAVFHIDVDADGGKAAAETLREVMAG